MDINDFTFYASKLFIDVVAAEARNSRLALPMQRTLAKALHESHPVKGCGHPRLFRYDTISLAAIPSAGTTHANA